MAATKLGVKDGPDHEERIIEAEDLSLDPPSTGMTGEMWTLLFECKGAPLHRDFVELELDRAYISFFNLVCLKDKFGYSGRDFLYYKKRCGRDAASLEVIDFDHQARAMIEDNEIERKVRLIMTKEEPTELQVTITPMKRPREPLMDEQPCVEEDLYAYKVWLAELQEQDPDTEFKDDYRQETIKTYKKWLMLEGDLPDDCSNDVGSIPNEETQDSSPSQAEWPSHARRQKENGKGVSSQGPKKRGRGTLKGLSAAYKRIKSGSQKLEIQFSSRLGGPIGINHRSFVDEVSMFTRLRAPLIGVRSWKDIKENVKCAIASDVLNRWDLQNTENAKQKIWDVARDRYTGWRATLSATYKAYKTDAERMKHKPEDVDNVEWHYLIKYFATKKFKNLSSSNSGNRKQKKTEHCMGSKPFSQRSFELRDPVTGEEPNDIDLWMSTHMRNGQWSNTASQDVFDNAIFRLSEKEVDQERDNLTWEEKNDVFQKSYKEVIGCKTTKIHGRGYLAKYPTRAQLMDAHIEQSRLSAAAQDKNKELEVEVHKLKEQLASEVETRRKIQEEEQIKREELREQLREEMLAMFAEHSDALGQQSNLPSKIQTDGTPRQILGKKSNNNLVARNLFNNNNGNGTPKYISAGQLIKAANKGHARSRSGQEDTI